METYKVGRILHLTECLAVGGKKKKVLWVKSIFGSWITGWRMLMIITELIHLRTEAGSEEGDKEKQPCQLNIYSERIWRKWCCNFYYCRKEDGT